MDTVEVSYDEASKKLSAYAKALGHPARVAILRSLVKKGEPVRGEIIEVAPLAPSTVAQHLRELKKAGLIRGRIFGAKSCYFVNTEIVHELLDYMGNFVSYMKEKTPDSGARKDCCC